MSGNNPYQTFINTLFKKETKKSTSKSTSDNDKVVTANLDNKSQMQLKQISDYLIKLNSTVENIYDRFMDYSSSKSKGKRKKETPKEAEENKEDNSSNDNTDMSKKKGKKVSKSQKKVDKKLSSKSKAETVAKTLNNIFRLGKNIAVNVARHLDISKNLRDLTQKNMDLASKSITSSSVLIDKNLRSMQLGMGLSNQDAVGLSKSMNMLNIDKSDLAYLTEGQRNALTEIVSMLDKLYNSVNLADISKLGNDIFMLQNKYKVLLESIETHVMDALTILEPVLDYASEILDQLFDIVDDIFGSSEFKTLVNNVGLIVQDILNFIKPIIEEVLGYIKEILPQLITAVNNIIVDLMPIIMNILSLIQPILEVVMNVLKPLLTIVVNFLSGIIATITEFINFLKPIIESLVSTIGEFLVALMPVINMILTAVSFIVNLVVNALKPIIETISTAIIDSLQIIIPILQLLEPVFNFITQVLEFLMPIITVVSNFIAMISSILLKVFDFLLAIRNAIVWWDQKNREDYLQEETPEFNFEVNTSMDVNAKNDVAKTYTPANNTSSISNKATNVTVDATFNQSISGTASAYAQELAKQNYESNQVLSELVQGAL